MATVAIYSDADRSARHTAMADEAYAIGPPPPGESYLRHTRIIDAARHSGAQAIHPGYGFLSENAIFADASAEAGMVFVGPPPAAIRSMGSKDVAKALMAKAGVPIVPGYQGKDQRLATLARHAKSLGYPVLIKAVAGGGGIGMRRVVKAQAFREALGSARRESQNAFGSTRVLIEKYIAKPRHVEVQIFADSHGSIVHMFERDCSMQRRHQKVVEEAPAPGLSAVFRKKLGTTAIQAARAIGYVGAGTVEFLVDASDPTETFYFMEMNARLQVEHPVTEAVTGLDLIEWQLRVAAGERLPKRQRDICINGHAIEARVYAEDPARGFLPSIGRLNRLELPDPASGIRVDSGVREGDQVTRHYDPMIAKIIVHESDRARARVALSRALAGSTVLGLRSNLGFLRRLLDDRDFASGDVDTHLIEQNEQGLAAPNDIEAQRLRTMAFLAAGLNRTGIESSDYQDRHAPWRMQKNWRLGRRTPFLRTLVVDGKPIVFEAGWSMNGSISLGIDGADPCVIADPVLRGEELFATIDGEPVMARFTTRGDEMEVSVAGDNVVVGLVAGLDEVEAKGGGATAFVVAPLPGRVVSVMVDVGTNVKKGALLVVLEAMKMEHTLIAPHAGIVEEVCCEGGNLVDEGATIIKLRDGPF